MKIKLIEDFKVCLVCYYMKDEAVINIVGFFELIIVLEVNTRTTLAKQ